MVQNVQNLSDRPSHVTLPLEYWTLKVSGIQMSGILMYRTYVYVKIIIFSTLILNIKMNYQMNNVFFGVIQSDAKINQFFGEFVHEKFFCHLVLKKNKCLVFQFLIYKYSKRFCRPKVSFLPLIKKIP